MWARYALLLFCLLYSVIAIHIAVVFDLNMNMTNIHTTTTSTTAGIWLKFLFFFLNFSFFTATLKTLNICSMYGTAYLSYFNVFSSKEKQKSINNIFHNNVYKCLLPYYIFLVIWNVAVVVVIVTLIIVDCWLALELE